MNSGALDAQHCVGVSVRYIEALFSRKSRAAKDAALRAIIKGEDEDDETGEEGEEDEDDHWDEDDIDEDAEDGVHYNVAGNNTEYDVISTDGWGMIEGEDLDFDDGFDAFD